MRRPERMLGSDLEVPGMAEEAREVGGNQPNQLPVSSWVTFLGGFQQVFDSGGVPNPQPPTAAAEKLPMTVAQLDARQP